MHCVEQTLFIDLPVIVFVAKLFPCTLLGRQLDPIHAMWVAGQAPRLIERLQLAIRRIINRLDIVIVRRQTESQHEPILRRELKIVPEVAIALAHHDRVVPIVVQIDKLDARIENDRERDDHSEQETAPGSFIAPTVRKSEEKRLAKEVKLYRTLFDTFAASHPMLLHHYVVALKL